MFPIGCCWKSFLSRYGECDVAANGREAVEAFRSRADRRAPYDLICMDIAVPKWTSKLCGASTSAGAKRLHFSGLWRQDHHHHDGAR